MAGYTINKISLTQLRIIYFNKLGLINIVNIVSVLCLKKILHLYLSVYVAMFYEIDSIILQRTYISIYMLY